MVRKLRARGAPPFPAMPKLVIPPYVPASDEEKARRRELGKEADRLRKLIEPIGMSTSDLIRQVRDETEDYHQTIQRT